MKRFTRILLGIIFAILGVFLQQGTTFAKSYWHYSDSATNGCRDVEVVFARGSGQPQDEGETFLELQKDISMAAEQAKMSYRITDLSYDAIAITPGNALGIYVSAGEAYSFGESVSGGVSRLKRYAAERSASCSNTYWILAGYSQGAMVITNALSAFPEDRVVYIMLFGDPKLYLPEGEGFNPPACRGENLSSYRVYVPDCDTDNGLLGARKPYEYPVFAGRYGLWCNDDDFICGSSKNPFNTGGHALYEENGSIRDASIYVLRRLNYLKQHRAILSAGADVRRQGDFGLVLSKSSIEDGLDDEDKLDTVLAQLRMTERAVNAGEMISFDASSSFSVTEEPLDFTWYVDGVRQDVSGSYFDYSFDEEDAHVVRVVVTDALGASSEATARVTVGIEVAHPADSPVPIDIRAVRCGEKRVCVSWVRRRGAAQYLGLRINDYYMGHVNVSNEELVIDDVDFSNINIAMGYMDAGYQLGEMQDLAIEGTIETVLTSASLPWWRVLAIAVLPFCCILLVRLLIKTVKDIIAFRR